MKQSILLLLAILCTAYDAFAGGPLGAVGTTPRRYAASSFPLAYRTDQGSLGRFTNATAVAISSYAFQQWDNVATAALSFTNAGPLARDVTSATDPYISGSTQFSDRINPVVFDTDGSITDAKLGVGARNSVLGFAGSAYSGATYVEGYAIINGALSGTGSAADQDKYRATMTHEIGHFLGVGHSQIAMHADFATMYPIIIKADQQTLDPDDISAISNLYPASGYSASVGSISGTVRRPNGANLSGVNVVAVNTSTGAAYSGVVDYFSGGKSGFDSPPAANGSYTIAGLPPGSYYVRIEPVNANFTGGSSIASYNTPVNTTVAREWYNGGGESGDMLLDNTNQQSGVSVTAGGNSGGINIVANESATLSSLAYHDGTPAVAFPIPLGSVTQYATRFTAPANGSLTSVKFLLQGNSTLPLNGTMTITVHANASGSIGGVPGAVLGSVTVPFRDLASDQHNEIWLRGLGSSINFTAGTNFHISFSTNGVGTPTFLTDDGNPTQNRSSYLIPSNGWRNFGEGGYNVGYNLIVSALYSTSSNSTTAPVPQITASPATLDYGRVRPGTGVSKTTIITNTGTATLNVTGVALLGPDSLDFRIVAGGGAFALAPGGSRTINLRFQPLTSGGTEDGSKSAQLSIVSNAERSPFAIPLLGNAVQPLAARFDTAIAFANTIVGTTSLTDTVIITNTCNDTLNIRSMTLSGADAGGAIKLMTEFEATGIPPKGGYRAKLQFAPTEQRMYNAVLRIEHDDSVGVTEFNVSGRGVASVLSLSAATLDAGSVKVGTERTLPHLAIRNTGDAPLTVTGLRVTGTSSSEFSIISPAIGSGSPITVAPGDSLDVRLRFTPASLGDRIASLEVLSATSPAVMVPLSGVGMQGVLELGTSMIDFGDIPFGKDDERTLELINSGNETVSVRSVAATGIGFSLVDPPAAGTSVAPEGTLAIRVRFAPGAVGRQIGAVTVLSDGLVPTLTATLAGRGVQAGLAIDRTAIAFGRMRAGESASDSLAIRNTGTAPLTVTGITLRGTDAAAFELMASATSFTIAPGDSQIIGVRFRAQSQQEGTLAATLVVEAEGGLGTEVPITASVGERLMISSAIVDFGRHSSTGVHDTVISLRSLIPENTTIVEVGLDARKEGIPGKYFQLVDRPVPFVIPGGDSAMLGIRFQPDGGGLYMATLTLRTDNPADSMITVLIYGEVAQQVGSVAAGTISAGGLHISQLLVAPNPVQDRADLLFRVGGTGRLPVTLTLTDGRGDVIATLYEGAVHGSGTLHEERLSFDLSGYPSGEYYITLSGGGRSTTAKLVIMR